MDKSLNLLKQLDNQVLHHCKVDVEENPSKKEENEGINLTHILRQYLSLGYFTCVIPFKPVQNGDTNSFQLKQGRYQKIICALLWVIYWFIVITETIRKYAEGFQSKKNFTAKSYFILLNDIEHDLVSFMYFKIIWKHREKFEAIVNYAMNLEFINQRLFKKSQMYIYFVYTILFSFSMLLLPFSNDVYVGQLKSPKQAFHQYVKKGRDRFFIEEDFGSYSIGNILFGVTEFLGTACWSQVTWVVNAGFSGPLPVVMWLAVREFEMFTNAIISSNEIAHKSKLQEIKTKYENLKRFSATINEIWSVAALVWILETVVRAVMIMNQLVSSRNVVNIISVVVWILSIAAVLILSGETYRKIDGFKTQLLEEGSFQAFYEHDKLLLKRLLKELDGGPIGIGAAGMYKLDYGFTAQLLIAVVTIFLLSFEKD